MATKWFFLLLSAVYSSSKPGLKLLAVNLQWRWIKNSSSLLYTFHIITSHWNITLLCRVGTHKCRHKVNKPRGSEGCVRFTYRRLCVPGPILYLSRRTLGRGLLSLCRGYTSESWSSPFYVSSGSRPSSPHIHLEDEQKGICFIHN